MTGHFILPGRIDTPFIYKVLRVRDGGVYALRSVSVYQYPADNAPVESRSASLKTPPNANTPCFVATMSFKRSERYSAKTVPFEHQAVPRSHLRDIFRSVLEGKRPESHPLAPSRDEIVGNEEEFKKSAEKFPGVDIRKVDMTAYNGVVGEGGDGRVGQWRQLSFYRLIRDEDEEMAGVQGDEKGKEEQEQEDVNLHISAHLYASDRNSLFMIQRALGYSARTVSLASLSHTVVFHGGPERLRMMDDTGGNAKWFVQEAWTSNSGENRGCHHSRLWDWENSEVIGTTFQDGMVRVLKEKTPACDLTRHEDESSKGSRRAQRVEMDVEIGGGGVKGKL